MTNKIILLAMNDIFIEVQKKYDMRFWDHYNNYCHIIKKLFIDNKCDDIKKHNDENDSMLYNIYGLYHRHVTQNYDEMEQNFFVALKHNNNDAMNNLV